MCYCFDRSIEEIEEQVATTGESTVIDHIAAWMKEACWCETKSPMGSCCIFTINQCIKVAKTKVGQAAVVTKTEGFEDCCAAPPVSASAKEKANGSNSGSKLGIFATFAAVFTAIMSSPCCWLPLLLVAFGASAVGVSDFFETYRFWFLAVTTILLALGFYLVYFRLQKCDPTSASV